jgi:D-alanyl-D-alanine carboxypeptidase
MLEKTPVGLAEIVETFGSLDVPKFKDRYITPFTLPYPLYYDKVIVHRARCHFLIVDNFLKALEALQKNGLSKYVQNYGGIYNDRKVRGKEGKAGKDSTHAWGIAIDLEPKKYPLGSADRFPDEVVSIFEECGFFYGGDFKGRKDPMHFQFAKGY